MNLTGMSGGKYRLANAPIGSGGEGDIFQVLGNSGQVAKIYKTGGTYRCNVCAPGYAAPELLQKCSDYVAQKPSASKNAYAETPLPTFTQETDNFALAIHVFKLL